MENTELETTCQHFYAVYNQDDHHVSMVRTTRSAGDLTERVFHFAHCPRCGVKL